MASILAAVGAFLACTIPLGAMYALIEMRLH